MGSALGWYLGVEGGGCCFVQPEGLCFGTCTKLGIVRAALLGVGLCLVPLTAHKAFSAFYRLSSHKSNSTCAGGQLDSGLFDSLPAVI